MAEPKVSIIVPVYKAEKYLARSLDSLQNQTLKDIEIILVDDESPDNSPALCDEAAASDSRIKVIHKSNEGAGKARNSGLAVARGEYVAFVDADDYVTYDMYETLYNVAEKYSSDLVMSGTIFVDGNMFSEEGEKEVKSDFPCDTHFDKPSQLQELRLGIIGALPEAEYDSKYGMSVWKNLFRRDIIADNNLAFESEREMLSEDALFMVDYISCINKATGISGAYYNYCRNEDSISKSYKKDRLDKAVVFMAEAGKRYSKDIAPEVYDMYLGRFWQAFCRVLCAQEILYAKDKGIGNKALISRLKLICTNPLTIKIMKKYPLHKLPLKQALFAYAVKYRLYFMQIGLVNLRSR